MSFKEKKYIVIRNAISYELANFGYNYLLLKREAVKWMYDNNYLSPYTPGFGTWLDTQIPNTYSQHADFFMETLLMKVLPVMQEQTEMTLVPCYSYTRIYKKGDILKRHSDRPSCEISTTLHLGGDPWSIFLDPTGQKTVIDEEKQIHTPNAPKGISINLAPGDMLVYSGCELEHWREPFEGEHCGQVFLHYNNIDGPFGTKNKFDRRPMLGIQKRVIPN
jgi:hypothetical protein|tara:strand:+ start:91 stop:750 length:660 start_codon:yes stop_codon:yes gene_type:complete